MIIPPTKKSDLEKRNSQQYKEANMAFKGKYWLTKKEPENSY